MSLFLKNLLFTVVVPGTVAFYIPLLIAGGRRPAASAEWGWREWAAMAPLLFGGAVYLRCVRDFATVGRGTPAPVDAPKRLVVAGLYRYVRNPMYVGVLSVVGGWAMFFRSWRILLYAAGLALAFHLFVVFYEEPRLARQYGASYEWYRRAVRRWAPGKRYEPGG